MLDRPVAERFDRLAQLDAELGRFVIDAPLRDLTIVEKTKEWAGS